MRMVYANIELLNGDDVALNRRGIISEDEIRRITVSMTVDSGATPVHPEGPLMSLK